MNTHLYDLCILGGGINGVAIARDAAGRGLKVFLCEKNDLASGTSSASSKLIHGGLRYLEYGELRLVHEALAEREILLNMAPHIIWPLTFYLPWERSLRPRWMIRLGLFLYDHLAKRHQLPASGSINFSQQNPHPLKESFQYGFHYADCWTDDARLVVLTAQDAHLRGADISLHTSCENAIRQQDHWQLQFKKSSGELFTLCSKVLVNATGPWVDDVSKNILHLNTQHHLQKIKGSHIVVPKIFDSDKAYILQNKDKRIIFVLPFLNDFHLIGTTDVPDNASPEKAEITAEEINYLCQSVNYYFKKQINAQDIIWSYSGVRGLVDDGHQEARDISRDYVLEITNHAAPLLSVFGGKITTHRTLAEHALDRLAPFLTCKAPAWTKHSHLPGGDLGKNFDEFVAACEKRYPHFPAAMIKRLAHAYGTLIDKILTDAKSIHDLGQHFGADLYEAEVRYLIAKEWAKSAEDILFRRSKLGLFLNEQQKARLITFLQAV